MKLNKEDLAYYNDELKRILPFASVYPLTIIVSSDTGKTKTLDLNAESMHALKVLFDGIENLKAGEK